MYSCCAWFCSDLHIRGMEDPKAPLFLDFLKFLRVEKTEKQKPVHLFLLGDIFDIWVGSSSYFVKRYDALVEGIRVLVQVGVKVVYIEGNKDFYLKDFWQKKLQVEVHARPGVFTLEPKKFYLEHGKRIGKEDALDVVYNSFVESSLARNLADCLPGPFMGFLGWGIGGLSSLRSRPRRKRKRKSGELRDLFCRYMEEKAKAFPEVDYFLAGHLHLPIDHLFKREGRECRAINLGSWEEGEPGKVLCMEIPLEKEGKVRLSWKHL